MFASGIWSTERNSLLSWIHFICASVELRLGKCMMIKNSARDCGLGLGAGMWEPSQALVSFHCRSDRLLGTKLVHST